MAYEPKEWACGDVVTADALNNMEQGIADAYELPSVTASDNGKVLGVSDGEYALVEQSGGVEVECQKLTHTFDSGDVIGIKIGRIVMLKFVRVQSPNSSTSLMNSKTITLPSGWKPASDYTSAEGISKNGVLCITQVGTSDATTRWLTPHFAFVSPNAGDTVSLQGFNESDDPQYKYFIDGTLTYVCAE